MLINRNKRPRDTIYYIAGCILIEIQKRSMTLDKLYEIIKKSYNDVLEYKDFILALNFLFLIEKISFSKGKVKKCG